MEKLGASVLERAEGGLRAEADGALLEVLDLVDVTADGAQVELVVVGSVDVVVRRQVALGVHGLASLARVNTCNRPLVLPSSWSLLMKAGYMSDVSKISP